MVNGDILDGITLLNGSYPQRYGNRLGARARLPHARGIARSHAGAGRRQRHRRVGRRRGSARRREGGLVAGLGAQELSRAAAEADHRRRRRLRVRLQRRAVEAGLRRVAPGIVSSSASSPAGRGWIRTAPLDERERRRRRPQPGGARQRGRGGSPRRRVSSLTSASRSALQQFSNANADGAGARPRARRARSRGAPTVVATRPATRHVRRRRAGAAAAARRRSRARLRRRRPRRERVTVARRRRDACRRRTGRCAGRPRDSRLRSTVGGPRRSLVADAATRTASPWVQAELPLSGTLKLRGGAGIYRQFPGVRGSRRANAPAVPIRPAAGARVSRRPRHRAGARALDARWQVTFYNREERDVAAALRLGAAGRGRPDWSASSPIARLGQRARRLRARRRAARPAPKHQRPLRMAVVFARRQPLSRPPDRRNVRRRLRSAPHVQRLRPAIA